MRNSENLNPYSEGAHFFQYIEPEDNTACFYKGALYIYNTTC